MKNKENPFQFTVELPRFDVATNQYYGLVKVRLKSAEWVCGYQADQGLVSDGQKRLVQAEVKTQIIKAIIDGEWEFKT